MNEKESLKERIREMVQLIRTSPLYHGTNSTSLVSIEECGLDPKIRLYNEQQLKRLEELLKKADENYSEYSDNFAQRICLAWNREAGIAYALKAPEVWEKIRCNYTLAGKRLNKLPKSEREEAKRIFDETIAFYGGSYPILVAVDPNAPQLFAFNHWLVNEQKTYRWLDGDRFVNGYDKYDVINHRLKRDKKYRLGWSEVIDSGEGITERIPREFILNISKVQ